jgi:hypothetical protein
MHLEEKELNTKHVNLTITLKHEYRIKWVQKSVYRRIFGPQRKTVTGGWRKLHMEKHHDVFSSSSIIKRQH